MTTSATQARLNYSASESDADRFEANGFSTGMFDVPGLDIHEGPGISDRNHTILKTGLVVTVEPDLYYSGMGGVRLEDVVLVTKTGCRNLFGIPRNLEV